ncbi:YheC/YheD family protein [Paenibacillus sp. LMG 31456]|uniref:YheC/YheD family protein n=1 Tax=Paenibacillus foliorum TaxID=2654974 RepID=A0A972GT69_9BACL|nr:YheC/YheD family protein [Paenibacillus foliorum]NOU92310.1 YheC/YheD family protein [Paenibacillus foliorum]
MMTSSSPYTLGIMTTQIDGNPPFLNRGFYRRLTLAGSHAGFKVFVFSPQSIDWLSGRVRGYAYDSANNQWLRLYCPFPDVVYDRCFFSTKQQYNEHRTTVRRLREQHRSVLFLGYGLRGKWEVQHMLEQDGRFNSHLPRTETMRSLRSVVDWLNASGEVLLKPQSGSQGRGVLLVQRCGTNAAVARASAGATPPAFTVRGRDARNRHVERGFADAPTLLRWLRRFTAQRSYLLQQYLLLQTRTGDAYDVRSLVQKDGAGRWQVTGMAVRRGQGGSLTSNLHGGGIVESAGPFLTQQFDADKASSIVSKLHELSTLIPTALEKYHGRLAELGIDFGIDNEGNIWILEVNSKPGRSIFTYLQDNQARLNALTHPIRYARYLLQTTRHRAVKQ